MSKDIDPTSLLMLGIESLQVLSRPSLLHLHVNNLAGE
ncbi:hypothetical protein SynSYN20_00122 [Synechococcus sp. SYN20]|nr:hypothetical protein SynSYN20_00122 [Synechococcus sp. SYN20]